MVLTKLSFVAPLASTHAKACFPVYQPGNEVRRPGPESGDRVALAPLLPQALIRSAHRMKGDLDDRGIAELVLAVYGVDTLRKLRDELEAAKLPAPKQWPLRIFS